MNKCQVSVLLLCFISINLAACARKQPVYPAPPLLPVQLAQTPELPPQPLLQSNQDNSIQELLNQAYQEWFGVPHQDGGLSKKGIDCSGFVHVVFNTKLGQKVPRSTEILATTGTKLPQNQLQPGDLILFNIRPDINHVGIYTGNDQFIHASKSQGVLRSELSLKYWQDHYWQSRRILK